VTRTPERSAAPATPQDVDELCLALPEVELGTSWGDRPTYKVRGKGFLLFRAPHKSAVDPVTGEEYDDLLVVEVASEHEKRALVEGDGPFFTIPHFDGYNAVLVQQSRLGEITRGELAEVIIDAWLKRAPKTLAKAYLSAGTADA
jgi:hypothetical protein